MSTYNYGMGRRRRRVYHRRRGGNIFDDIGSGFMKAHDFFKKHKIISGVSGALSLIPGPVGNVAKIINTGSSALGYGRRRRRQVHRRSVTLKSLLSRVLKRRSLGSGRRRRVYRRRVYRRRGGATIRSRLSGLHKFVKEKRLISSALKHFLPKSHLGTAIHLAGYGRKRRRHYGVRRRGGAFFPFTTEQLAVPKFS